VIRHIEFAFETGSRSDTKLKHHKAIKYFTAL